MKMEYEESAARAGWLLNSYEIREATVDGVRGGGGGDAGGQLQPDKWSSRTSVEKEFLEAATRKQRGASPPGTRTSTCSQRPESNYAFAAVSARIV